MLIDGKLHIFFLFAITMLTIFVLYDIRWFNKTKEKWYLGKIVAWVLVIIIIYIFMYALNMQ